MTDHDALAELNQALIAIDVILRNGKVDAARVSALAREARRSAERITLTLDDQDPPTPCGCAGVARPVVTTGP